MNYLVITETIAHANIKHVVGVACNMLCLISLLANLTKYAVYVSGSFTFHNITVCMITPTDCNTAKSILEDYNYKINSIVKRGITLDYVATNVQLIKS